MSVSGEALAARRSGQASSVEQPHSDTHQHQPLSRSGKSARAPCPSIVVGKDKLLKRVGKGGAD